MKLATEHTLFVPAHYHLKISISNLRKGIDVNNNYKSARKYLIQILDIALNEIEKPYGQRTYNFESWLRYNHDVINDYIAELDFHITHEEKDAFQEHSIRIRDALKPDESFNTQYNEYCHIISRLRRKPEHGILKLHARNYFCNLLGNIARRGNLDWFLEHQSQLFDDFNFLTKGENDIFVDEWETFLKLLTELDSFEENNDALLGNYLKLITISETKSAIYQLKQYLETAIQALQDTLENVNGKIIKFRNILFHPTIHPIHTIHDLKHFTKYPKLVLSATGEWIKNNPIKTSCIVLAGVAVITLAVVSPTMFVISIPASIALIKGGAIVLSAISIWKLGLIATASSCVVTGICATEMLVGTASQMAHIQEETEHNQTQMLIEMEAANKQVKEKIHNCAMLAEENLKTLDLFQDDSDYLRFNRQMEVRKKMRAFAHWKKFSDGSDSKIKKSYEEIAQHNDQLYATLKQVNMNNMRLYAQKTKIEKSIESKIDTLYRNISKHYRKLFEWITPGIKLNEIERALNKIAIELNHCLMVMAAIPHLSNLRCNRVMPSLDTIPKHLFNYLGYLVVTDLNINITPRQCRISHEKMTLKGIEEFIKKPRHIVYNEIRFILKHHAYHLPENVIALEQCSKLARIFNTIADMSIMLSDIKKAITNIDTNNGVYVEKKKLQQLSQLRKTILSQKDEIISAFDQNYIDEMVNNLAVHKYSHKETPEETLNYILIVARGNPKLVVDLSNVKLFQVDLKRFDFTDIIIQINSQQINEFSKEQIRQLLANPTTHCVCPMLTTPSTPSIQSCDENINHFLVEYSRMTREYFPILPIHFLQSFSFDEMPADNTLSTTHSRLSLFSRLRDKKNKGKGKKRYDSHRRLPTPFSKKNSRLLAKSMFSHKGTIMTTTTGQRFTRHPVASNGECGYTAFGIDRQMAYDLLVERIIQIRDMLATPVKEQLLNEHFIEYVQSKQTNRALLQAFATYQQAALQGEQTVVDAINKLLAFATKDLVLLKHYIDYDMRDKQIDAGWSHPCVLQALAEIREIKLYIWQLNPQGKLIPHQQTEYHQHLPRHALQRTDLLFINGNHFERLEEEASRFNATQQQSMATPRTANHENEEHAPTAKAGG